MTDYAYTGKKGTGKSKNAVRVARDLYFTHGRLVASNLDIYLEKMFGSLSKITYVRVPDKPCAFDLHAIGHGNPDSYDEDKNGALILDEMGTWLNTRTFGDKQRAETLDYFAHARKHGFDTFYIMQNVIQVDKQLRESFIEQTVRHTRFDKVRIPFIGRPLSALFGRRWGYFPKFHTAVSRIGFNPQDMVSDRVTFTGKDIEPCYDTRQVFQSVYPHGTHTVLSPWHTVGRFLPEPVKPWWVLFWDNLRGMAAPLPKRVPVTAPSPALARVVALSRGLSPLQALRVVSAYNRAAMRGGEWVRSAPKPTRSVG